MITEKTYEMLWDCKYCGQRKLLGLSQRFCPKCGGPQDATKRYFPPDDEKIAVQDHPFVGADVQCPACNAWNSRAAAHCTGCGGPLGAGRAAPLRQEGAPPGPLPGALPGPGGYAQAMPQAQPPKKSALPWILGGVGLALIAVVGLVLVAVFWKKGAQFQVTSRTWERSIEIETFGPVRRSSWCDEMPGGARAVSRHAEQRSTRKIPDGQTCSKHKKDNGDGTYKEVTECTPKYREEPIMGDKCDYDVDQWKPERTLKATGSTKDDPRWPAVDIRRGACAGCEREGQRKETYSVVLRDAASGKEGTCSFGDVARWSAFKDGARYDGKMGVMTGSIDCDSLGAAGAHPN